MVAFLVALMFTTAFAVSLWSMWITVAPRLSYMRLLLADGRATVRTPVPARRVRMTRAAMQAVPARAIRAAA